MSIAYSNITSYYKLAVSNDGVSRLEKHTNLYYNVVYIHFEIKTGSHRSDEALSSYIDSCR